MHAWYGMCMFVIYVYVWCIIPYGRILRGVMAILSFLLDSI